MGKAAVTIDKELLSVIQLPPVATQDLGAGPCTDHAPGGIGNAWGAELERIRDIRSKRGQANSSEKPQR